METFLIVDAVRRMQPKKITMILPWFAYAPQDKIFREGEPLSSEVIIRVFENLGVDRFVTVDIHSKLVLDMFKKKVTHLSARSLFVKYLSDLGIKNSPDWVVATLDKGNVVNSQKIADDLGFRMVKFEKQRDFATGKVTFVKLDGEVNGKKVLIFDDYTSTGQTLVDSAKILKEFGAVQYYCCVTHVIVEETLKKIEESEIDLLLTTNSTRFADKHKSEKIKTLDLAELLVEACFGKEV